MPAGTNHGVEGLADVVASSPGSTTEKSVGGVTSALVALLSLFKLESSLKDYDLNVRRIKEDSKISIFRTISEEL